FLITALDDGAEVHGEEAAERPGLAFGEHHPRTRGDDHEVGRSVREEDAADEVGSRQVRVLLVEHRGGEGMGVCEILGAVNGLRSEPDSGASVAAPAVEGEGVGIRMERDVLRRLVAEGGLLKARGLAYGVGVLRVDDCMRLLEGLAVGLQALPRVAVFLVPVLNAVFDSLEEGFLVFLGAQVVVAYPLVDVDNGVKNGHGLGLREGVACGLRRHEQQERTDVDVVRWSERVCELLLVFDKRADTIELASAMDRSAIVTPVLRALLPLCDSGLRDLGLGVNHLAERPACGLDGLGDEVLDVVWQLGITGVAGLRVEAVGLEPRHDVRERVASDEAVAVDYGDETAGDDLAVFVGERAEQQ